MNIPEITAWRAQASIGMLVLLLVWESAAPFFSFFAASVRPLKERVAHGMLNVGLGVVNALVVRFVFLALWVSTMAWTANHDIGVLNWLDMPAWGRVVLAVLLLDLWTYSWHRLNHAVPLFWRLHRLHHSDRAMDVTTANRFHLGEITLSSLFRVPIFVLIGCRLEELALYEVMLFAVVQFHHANIGLPEWLDRALRVVIVTPHLHKVHHSVVRAEQNANYSSLFSWWDRAARTLSIAPDLRKIRFGVDD